MTTWRDSGMNPNEHPTVHAIVVCAEDRIERRDVFELFVLHARTLRGPCYMARVSCGGSGETGSLFPASDPSSYERACAEGRAILARHVAELDARIAELSVPPTLRTGARPG